MTFKAKNIGDFGVCEWEHQIDGFKATWPGHYLTCGTWFSSALKILTSTDANVLTCTYVNMYRLIQLVQLLESSITNQINPLKKRLVVKFIINIYFKDMELSDWYLNATWSKTESPGKAQQVKKIQNATTDAAWPAQHIQHFPFNEMHWKKHSQQHNTAGKTDTQSEVQHQ